MKVGRFIIRNGEISWKSNDDIDTGSASQVAHTRISSVATPSCITKFQTVSRKNSEVPTLKSYHMANPNPQDHQPKYKGVRELGYKQYEQLLDPVDVVKFGKRISYDNKLTNEQLVEEHLK